MVEIPDDVVERARAAFDNTDGIDPTEWWRAAGRVFVEWERAALAEFSKHTNWSLEFKTPVYGDDDDQERCWVVHEQTGPINDREWEIIGKGETAIDAILAAIRARSLPEDKR